MSIFTYEVEQQTVKKLLPDLYRLSRFLNRLIIEVEDGSTATFPCYRWLGVSEYSSGDHSADSALIELAPSNVPEVMKEVVYNSIRSVNFRRLCLF